MKTHASLSRLRATASRSQRMLIGAVAVGLLWRVSSGAQTMESKAIGLLVGLLAVLMLRDKPHVVLPAAATMGILFPLLPSIFVRFGAPISLIRPYTYYKDLALIIALVALTDPALRRRGPVDAVERWGGGFVLLTTAYLVFPLASPNATAPDFNVRIYGWRLIAEWAVFLLAARRLVLNTRTTTNFLRSVIGIATLEALSCIYQQLSPAGWDNLVTTNLQVQRFLALTVGSTNLRASSVSTLNEFDGINTIRVGGLTLDTAGTGSICIVLVGCLAPYAASRSWSTSRMLPLLGCLVAAVLTLTRSAVLGCVVALAVVLLQRSTKVLAARTRAVLVTAGSAVVALPLLVGSNFVRRIEAGFNGNDASATAHAELTSSSLGLAAHNLFGLGLGTNPSVATRFKIMTSTAENAYIQTSLELGVLGLLLLVGFLVSIIRSCLRANRALQGSPWHLGAAAATAGMLAMSVFLDPFLDYTTLYLFAAVVAIAQPPTDPREGAAAGAAPLRFLVR